MAEPAQLERRRVPASARDDTAVARAGARSGRAAAGVSAADADVGRLRAMGAAKRAGTLAGLQAAVGNRGVQRVLADESSHQPPTRTGQPTLLRTPTEEAEAQPPASSVLDPPGSTAPAQARIFVYDTDDPNLDPVWKAAAEHWADAYDGIALESGSTGRETLSRIISAYEEANRDGRYECIRSIEFFGHGLPGMTLSHKFTASDVQAAAILDAARVAEHRRAHETMARVAALVANVTGSASDGLGGTAQQLADDLKAAADAAEATARQRLRAEGHSAAWGNLEAHLGLAEEFGRLRGLLCGDSYLHLRTCSSLKGQGGEVFGESLARLLDTHIVGHEVVIDTFLQEWRYFAPGGAEVAEVPEEVRPGARGLHQVPRHLRIDVDLSELTGEHAGWLESVGLWWARQALRTLELDAEVTARPDDPESHNLRVTFRGPELHVHLSEIARLLTGQHSASGDSPTVEAMETEGRAVIVPINRTIVERFAVNPAPMVFTIPTDVGPVTVSVTPAESGPSWLARRGGLQLGVEPLIGGGFEQRPYVRVPLADWRGGLRLSAEAAGRMGPTTAIPEAGLVGSLHILDTLYAYTSVYGGLGDYGGGRDLRLGLRSGVGLQLGELGLELTRDRPLRDSPGGSSLLFRLSWTFGQ